MAFKNWHPGQLVMFLAGCGLLWYGVRWVAVAELLDVSGALVVFPIVALLILAAIPAVAAVVLWKWFGARKKPPGPSA